MFIIKNIMITNYEPSCKYRLDKLEKEVYLISEDALKDVHIDNGVAYVDNVVASPLSFKVSSIEVSDEDEVDERFKFVHTLRFSVDGYMNYEAFQGKYYAIVKTSDSTFWLLNPFLPCLVTYVYTLDSRGSRTDFTLSTASNFPVLKVEGISFSAPSNECRYARCTFESLKLNNTEYSIANGDNVVYTNDGFKDVMFQKNSAAFTEQFDGENVQHQILFSINFDDYKSSWHYNLIEFTENKYSAVIKTSKGNYILCGFYFGLFPSFTVEADDSTNRIEIRLYDLHDNGDFIDYRDNVYITKDGAKSFVYTSKYNGYECVGNGIARYLLKEEVDALGNPTGNYMVLNGYASYFPNLTIVGTFNTTETFASTACVKSCVLNSTIPFDIVFTSTTCVTYTVNCNSDWTISSDSNEVTVSPSQGNADTTYSVTICNNHTPTNTSFASQLTLNYCSSSAVYNVTVKNVNTCLTSGNYFSINANWQYVIIPTSCCVRSVSESTNYLNNITIQNGYIRVSVPQNESDTNRSFQLTITYCDNTSDIVTIEQEQVYERWVTESTVCNGSLMCDVQRRYTGTTASDINTRTQELSYTNCAPSSECVGTMTRWVDMEETVCVEDELHLIQKEEESTDRGITWTDTLNRRIGEMIPDVSGQCSTATTYEYRWVLTYETTCQGYDKYYTYKQQRRESGSTDAWEDTVPSVYSIDGNGTMPTHLVEASSVECGYFPPVEIQYKWETMNINSDYVCAQCASAYKINYVTSQGSATTSCNNAILSFSDFNNLTINKAYVGSCVRAINNNAFSGCTALEEIEIPSSVVSIGASAFKGCTSLVKIGVPAEVIEAYAFSGCSKLNSVVMANTETIGENAFAYCSSLQSINICSEVTTIPARCFMNCGLSDISIPASITEIGDSAFQNCSKLVSIRVEGFIPPTLGTNVFDSIHTYAQIYVPVTAVNTYKTEWSDYASIIMGY